MWKRQPGRRRDRARHVAAEHRRARAAPGSGTGIAASSACVYGWRGAREQRVARRRHLDDACRGTSPRRGRRCGCTTAEVVRDEDVGQAEAPLQVLQQVDHLRLHRDVERRHRLVARRSASARPPARARCRCAGAGRRRTRADSAARAPARRPDRVAAARPRARARGRACTPCSCSGSASVWPTVMRGLSERVRVLEDDLHRRAAAPAAPRRRQRAEVARPSKRTRAGGRARSAAAPAGRASTCRSRFADDRQRLAGATARSTPSTARTAPRARPNSPRRTGKCLTRPSTCSSGARQRWAPPRRMRRQHLGIERRAPAGRPRARRRPRRSGGSSRAAVLDRRTGSAAAKRQPGGRPQRVGHLALDRREPLALAVAAAGSSRAGRRCTDAAARRTAPRTGACSTMRPGIHHGHLVGDLGDDAEVVRDQDHRGAGLAAAASRISSRICAWIVTSSAVVGSSAISSRGSQASAIAIIARWRMPPESWCGYSSKRCSGAGMRTCAQHLDRARPWPRARPTRPVPQQRLDDLLADGEGRVQRRSSAPGRSSPCRCRAGPAASRLRQRRPARGPRSGSSRRRCGPAGRHQAHDRQRRHALAAARFADDGQRAGRPRR